MSCTYRARFAPRQWETALLCNDASHWLGASLKSALTYFIDWGWNPNKISYTAKTYENIFTSVILYVAYRNERICTQATHIDVFVLDCNISSALAMDLLQSCTKHGYNLGRITIWRPNRSITAPLYAQLPHVSFKLLSGSSGVAKEGNVLVSDNKPGPQRVNSRTRSCPELSWMIA